MKGLRAALRNRTTIVGFALTVLLTLAAIFAPWIAPLDPLSQSIPDRMQQPTGEHWFGTDRLGRDIFSRTIFAARISLSIGLGSVLIGAIIGTVFGIYATLRGGILERALVNGIDVMMSFPTLLLCLMVLVVLGPGLWSVAIAIGVAMTPRFARLSRGPTLALREAEFVEASRSLGSRTVRTALWHVLPNVAGPIGVMAILWMATAIRIEASLSFLGFGVQPPTPTWGNMIEQGFQSLTFAPFLSVYPGLAILFTVFGLNLLGDGLRDVFDPRDVS